MNRSGKNSLELRPLVLALMLAGSTLAMAADDECKAASDCSETMDHGSMDHGSMDHGSMDHGSMDHGSMTQGGMVHSKMMDQDTMMDHGAMMNHGDMNHDMSSMQNSQAPAGARDPHAWSGGYQRGSGPYIPAQVGHLHTMDSHHFMGVRLDELEQVNEGDNGLLRSGGEFWYGTTWDRGILEWDAEHDNGETEAELGAYWQHAVSAFWNRRLGVRHDLGQEQDRTWVGGGFEGLAPYWFETEVMLYGAGEGVLELALHSEYDLLLTQRLILQPTVAVHIYNKEDPQGQFDAGLGNSNAAVRLRYEISRQFAPYVGFEREHWYGGTATLTGEQAVSRWMAGARVWF